jgi:hypothetical protein
MDVVNAQIGAIGLALDIDIKKRETLQMPGVKTVAVFSDSQAAIHQAAHLQPGPRQRLGRKINRMVWSLLPQGIATETHLVLGNSGIPGTKETACQANLA